MTPAEVASTAKWNSGKKALLMSTGDEALKSLCGTLGESAYGGLGRCVAEAALSGLLSFQDVCVPFSAVTASAFPRSALGLHGFFFSAPRGRRRRCCQNCRHH